MNDDQNNLTPPPHLFCNCLKCKEWERYWNAQQEDERRDEKEQKRSDFEARL